MIVSMQLKHQFATSVPVCTGYTDLLDNSLTCQTTQWQPSSYLPLNAILQCYQHPSSSSV